MNRMDYFLLPWYKKLWHKAGTGLLSFFKSIAAFFAAIPRNAAKSAKAIGRGIAWLFVTFFKGGLRTKLSYVIMGAGNLFRGQIIKGLLFLAAEVGFVLFIVFFGWEYIKKLPTLGTIQRGWYYDEELGIDVLIENGDNSMLI